MRLLIGCARNLELIQSSTSIREKLSSKFYSEDQWVHNICRRDLANPLPFKLCRLFTTQCVELLDIYYYCCCFTPGKSWKIKLQSWKILVFLLSRSVKLAKRIWGLSREGLSLLFTEAQKLGWRSIGGGNVSEWLVQLVCGPWSATFPSMIKYFVEK